MLIAAANAMDSETLPFVRAAISAAMAEHRPLAVYVEAERLLDAHPELRVPLDQLAEDIMRFATYAGAVIEVG
jgi:hypothetical protein